MSEMTIPDGWKIKNYGDLLSLHYGKSPKDVKNDDGEYPIIGTGGYVGFANDYTFDGESIVIGRKGTIDKPTFVEGKFWAIDTTYFTSTYKNAFPKWFYYIVAYEGLGKYNEATGVPSLNRDTFNSIKALVPPLPEQQKIASILTSVDDVIEKTQSQINKLQDLKKGTMNELLTRGIGHTEFVDSPIGKIPRGWDVVEFGEYMDIRTGKGFQMSEYSESGIRLVRIDNVSWGKIDWNSYVYLPENYLQEYPLLSLKEGDLLLALNRPVTQGKLKIAFLKKEDEPAILYQRVGKILFNSDEIDKHFIYYILNEILPEFLKENAVGSDQPFINISSLRKLEIPLPSLPEQQKISSILSSIDKNIEEKQRKLEQTKSLKKSLMQDLLIGKVRVAV